MNDVEGAQETEQERTYQIGTVSSLTGIDAHTIRAWERRYRAIEPMRSEPSSMKAGSSPHLRVCPIPAQHGKTSSTARL